MTNKIKQRISRQPFNEVPKLKLSFEFFPPKSDKAEERFWQTLEKLAPLDPSFVSVTYGAGGSTRERTLNMVAKITEQSGIDRKSVV